MRNTAITLTVIGDSAAFGTGDFDSEGNPRGWGHYLAEVFEGSCNYFNFSRPGAKSKEVVEVQLPRAMETNPDICAVIVGGNDMLRNGFDPKALYENISSTSLELMSRGSEIIMVELHDPGQLLRIPRLLKRVLRRRVDAVNDVYYKVAEELDIILIRTRSIPDVHHPRHWHIDRMHPGPFGHQLLAREMATQLRERGWELSVPEATPRDMQSRYSKIFWLITHATPWFLKRSVDLLPVALILMAIEFIRVLCEISMELFRRGYSAVIDQGA